MPESRQDVLRTLCMTISQTRFTPLFYLLYGTVLIVSVVYPLDLALDLFYFTLSMYFK